MEYNNIQELCYAMLAEHAAQLESTRGVQTSNVRDTDAANNQKVIDATNDQTSKSNLLKLRQHDTLQIL